MSLESLQFKRATKGDQEFIKKHIYSVLLEYGLTPEPDGTDFDLNDLEKYYFENSGWFEVVTDPTGKVVGTWGILKITSDICELRKMYLDKSTRGKGLGKQLMDRSLKKAKSLGYQIVDLQTASVLKEAIGLYKKYGFQIHQAEDLAKRCDQAYRLRLG